MKSLLTTLLLVIAVAFTSNAQTDVYAAGGVSIGNSGTSDFASTSYPSLELGIMRDNYSVGLVAGLSDFNDNSTSWYELKLSHTVLSNDDGYGVYILGGVGTYDGSQRVFIEYGTGVSYSWEHLGIFTQASNWDGSWYITPGLSYTF